MNRQGGGTLTREEQHELRRMCWETILLLEDFKRAATFDWDESQHPRNPDGTFGEGGQTESAGQRTGAAERQKKIASVKIDFGRDNLLPGLNEEDLAELGKEDKPVKFKKETIARNRQKHPDINENEYNRLIGQALYNRDLIVPTNDPINKPNYYNFIKRFGEENAIVLLEISETKSDYEIVHVLKLNNKNFNRMDKKTAR
jgi:hypothetical protein